MSETGDRTIIAAALSTVDGITGYESRPAVRSTGDGWPVWVSTARYTLGSWLDTWHVWVVIAAGDDATVTSKADALIVPVWAALEDIAEVQLCEGLSVVDSDAGTQGTPVLRYTITTTRGGPC